jgi:hypothetical protein
LTRPGIVFVDHQEKPAGNLRFPNYTSSSAQYPRWMGAGSLRTHLFFPDMRQLRLVG